MPGREIRIGGVYATFRARNTQFLQAMRQNSDALRRQRDRMRALRATARRTQQQMTALGGALRGALGAAVFAGATAGFRNLGRSSAQLGANLVETSRQLGVTTEQLQLFGRVAEGDGVAIRDFENSLRQLNRRLGESALGEGEYIEAFERLGIALRDASGQTRGTIDVFLEAADAIAELPTAADRAIAAYELFGRQGIRLLPILQGGREALEAQADSFREFGLISQEQAVTLKALEQSYTDTGTIIRTAVAGITADNADLFDSFNRIARAVGPAAFEGIVGALQSLRQNLVVVRAGASLATFAFLRWAGVFRVLQASAIGLAATLGGLATGTVALSAALNTLRFAAIRTGILAAVVAAGELTFRFLQLRQAGDSAGQALRTIFAGIGEIFLIAGDQALIFFRRIQLANAQIGAGIGEGIRAGITGGLQALNLLINAAQGTALGFLAVFERLGDAVFNVLVGAFDSVERVVNDLINRIITGVNRVVQIINQSGIAQRLNINLDEVELRGAPALRVRVSQAGESIADEFRRSFGRAFEDSFIDIDNALGDAFSGAADVARRQGELIDAITRASGRATPALDRMREVGRTAGLEIEDTMGRVTDVSERALESLRRTTESAGETSRVIAERVTTIADDLQSNLENIYSRGVDETSRLLTNAITGVESLGQAARQVAFSIIQDILNAYIRSGILNILGGIGLQLPGGIQFRQFGGPVQRGRPYVVGERRPELFVPDRNGTIVPNTNGLGGSMVFNFSPVIQVTDRRAVDQALAEAYPVFEDRVRSGIIADQRRPSPLRRT